VTVPMGSEAEIVTAVDKDGAILVNTSGDR
jgi:hypothetical protein